MEILTGGPYVRSFRCEVVAGIDAGFSVAVALSEALCCPLCSFLCQGDDLSCSEKAKSKQGCTRYQRMLSGRAICLQPVEGAAAHQGVGRAQCVCRRMGQAAGSFSQVFPACFCRLCLPHSTGSCQDLKGFQICVQSTGLQQHRVRVWEGLGSVCSAFLMRGRNQEALPASNRCGSSPK